MHLHAIFPRHPRFRETHWPVRPLVEHAPLARLRGLATARPLTSADGFFALAARARVPLFVERPGERSYESLIAPDDPHRLAGGATYTLAAAERVVPAIAELGAVLASELALPSGVVPSAHLYLSSTGARVRPHFDRQENLAIHFWGRKRWWIAENETIAFPFEDHALATPPPRSLQKLAREWPTSMPASTQRIAMRSGTVVFLPRGAWHATETLTPSLSLTIIFPLISFAHALTSELLQRLLLDPTFRAPACSSPRPLADAFAAAARAVCAGDEERVSAVADARLRGHTLETDTLSIALDPRYVSLVSWMLANRSVRLAEAPPGLDPSEVSAVISFLESHGVVRRAALEPTADARHGTRPKTPRNPRKRAS